MYSVLSRKALPILLFVLLLIAISVTVSSAHPALLSEETVLSGQTRPTQPDDAGHFLLPDDIMPPDPGESFDFSTTTDVYAVQPILFVPADVEPNPYGLVYIDRQMRNVQHWYAEQLRGETFTFLPTKIIIGLKSRIDYFVPCYPPINPSDCSWGYSSWYNIYNELDARGYLAANQLAGVFFQGEGMSTALGGGRRFLVGFSADSLFPDCAETGCAYNISQGGLAHELGHALGLGWHPEGSEEAYYSVMSTGLYGFPHCTFINTAKYPERDILLNSPFINTTLALANPGFEACLEQWDVKGGSPGCRLGMGRSGKRGLVFEGEGPHEISQTVNIDQSLLYDVSGWLSSGFIPQGGRLVVKLLALEADGTVIETITPASLAKSNQDWTRFAQSLRFPDGTQKVKLLIKTVGPNLDGQVDDLSLTVSSQVPPMPLISKAYDGDAVANTRPTLSWSPVLSATSFEIQIASDPFFETIIEQGSTVDFSYQVLKDLPYDNYVFWRVRSKNGAGSSDWSPVWSLISHPPGQFYNDEFELFVLDNAWSIIRESPLAWRIGGVAGRRWTGYLVIDMQPGDLELKNNARNLVLRDAPPGDFSVETQVNFFVPLNANFQQGGLILYKNDDNYIKLFHEWRDGWQLAYEVEINGQIVRQSSVPIVDETRLKIERRANSFAAYYSTNGLTWIQLGQPVDGNWSNLQMGLFAYSVLSTSNVPYAAFNWLRVGEPCHVVEFNTEPLEGGRLAVEGAECGHKNQYRPDTPLRLTAVPEPGYTFDHWSGDVSGSSNPLTIQVKKGLTATAHFSLDSSITICKKAYPQDDTAFDFVGDLGSFTLTDPSNKCQGFDNLDPISYEIAETLHPGWELERVLCQENSGIAESKWQMTGDQLTIDLAAGSVLTCTFSNWYDPNEPNDSIEEATPINYGESIHGSIMPNNFRYDVDYYRFDAAAGDTIAFSIDTSEGGLYPGLCLFSADGSEMLCDDNSYLQTILPEAGEYYLSVNGIGSEGGSGEDGPYILSLGRENQAPLAVADNFNCKMGTTLFVTAPGVLENDEDPDADSLTAELMRDTMHGELSLQADGSFSYKPDPGYSGSDSFEYQVFDGKTKSLAVNVDIVVQPWFLFFPLARTS